MSSSSGMNATATTKCSHQESIVVPGKRLKEWIYYNCKGCKTSLKDAFGPDSLCIECGGGCHAIQADEGALEIQTSPDHAQSTILTYLHRSSKD